MVTIKT